MRGRFAALALIAVFGACQAAEGQKSPLKPSTAPAETRPPPRPTDVTARDYVMPPLPHAKVTLKDAYGGTHPIDVEVAATRDAETRGLMWRTELPEGKGMIFIFNGETVHNFWMQNTLIPLDMLFIATDGTVVGIVERAEPQTTTARTVGKPSKYVLEVPGGWCAKLGVVAGSKATVEGTEAIKVEY
jgi:uncharacterized membrane protein (UPF0127 family)